jgi:hypothetical protein
MDKTTKQNLPVKARVGRPNKVDTIKRTREVGALLLLCKPRSEIIDFLCKTYGVQEISCNNIISQAYKYLQETHEFNREGTIVLHLQYYYDIYRTAISLGDSRGAIMALNSVEKLVKLTLPETAIQNNNFNIDVSKLDINQLKELLELNKT